MKQACLVILLCLTILGTSSVSYGQTPEMPSDSIWIETPFGSPVIDRGAEGTWDNYAVDNPYVYVEDGNYYCFFEAQDVSFSTGDGHERIGLAISEDGTHWEKLLDPIIDVGTSGSWDSIAAKLPAGVTKYGEQYYLYYSGRDETGKRIGFATADEITGPWVKCDENPVISGRSDSWDRYISTYPAPLFNIEGQYHLLFRGMTSYYQNEGVGVATSTDLVHWDRVPEILNEPLTATEEEIASLAVAEVNGQFVGISQTLNPEECRRYWYSDDLINWTKGPEVQFLASGHVDTLSNPFLVNGEWNVVYEQGDRIYQAVLKSAETFEPAQLAHWTFDTDFNDSIGDNHGTPFNRARISTDAKVGAGALQLSSIKGQYVTVDGLAGELINGVASTLTLWFKTESQGDDMVHNGDNVIFAANGVNGSKNVYRMGTGLNGGVYWNPTNIDGSTPDEEGGSGLNDGQWHFVALVVDEDGTTTAYCDVDESGTLQEIPGFTDYSDQPAWSMASTFSFGQEWDGTTPTNFYDGLIDDVQLWRGALAFDDLQAVYDTAVGIEKIPGDANRDGKVDGADVTILAGNWQYGVDSETPDATWNMGDFNGDGRVDGADVTILAGNWQYGINEAANVVPEPGMLLMIFVFMFTIYTCKPFTRFEKFLTIK